MRIRELKFLITVWVVLLLNGCTTLQEFNKDSQKDVENSGYVYEKKFEYPYREVFLSSLNVVRDWGSSIFSKDYDKGFILARDVSGNNFDMPGRISGLYFSKIDDNKTKVTLKVTRRLHGLDSATPEDVFMAIEKEIQFRQKMSEK